MVRLVEVDATGAWPNGKGAQDERSVESIAGSRNRRDRIAGEGGWDLHIIHHVQALHLHVYRTDNRHLPTESVGLLIPGAEEDVFTGSASAPRKSARFTSRHVGIPVPELIACQR